MSTSARRGFTLVELVVVVGIVAILGTIFMSIFMNARSQGADAAIKSGLLQARSRAELFGADHNGFAGGAGVVASLSPCPAAQAVNAGSDYGLMGDANFFAIIQEARERADAGNVCSYAHTGTAWVVAISFKSDQSKAWCVDSRNESKMLMSGSPFTQGVLNATLFGIRCN